MQQVSAVLQRTAADTQLSWPAQTVATETRVYNSIVSGPIQTQSLVLSQYPLTDEQNSFFVEFISEHKYLMKGKIYI